MAEGSPAEMGNEFIEFQFVRSFFLHLMSNLTQVLLPEVKPDIGLNLTSLIFFCFLLALSLFKKWHFMMAKINSINSCITTQFKLVSGNIQPHPSL